MGRGESQTEQGRLRALNQDGFMVLEVNHKYVLIFKGWVDALGEVEYPPYGDCLSTPTRPAG
jgi:hypothetical protein